MALKGKQKKLDKNNNGKIDAEDFKILQGSKKGMRMGGMMYAEKGGMSQESKGRRMSKDELKLSKEMSKRDRYQSYAKNEKTRAFKTPKEAAEVDIKLQKLVDYNVKKGDPVDVDVIGMKSYEKPTSKTGSFKSGGLSDTMKKLRKKAYEKSGKKSKNIGKFGDDEYMIQKKLPGMKKGKSVDMIKITPTVKGKPMKARPFSPSKFDRGVMSRDYKFDKK